MFSKFLLIVGTTIFLFLAGGFFLPRYVHVERSIEIERPAAPVFALINSYSTFASWSPWAERDPDAVYEFTGPETGVGARMSWSGDPRLVGSGWQEITESVPHSLVRTRLFFDQQGAAVSYFQLDETEQGVLVTWGFDTDLTEGQSFLGGLLARYFGLMFDRWIGTDYEQGLAKLKVYAEGLPVARPAPVEIEILDVPARDILYVAVDQPPVALTQSESDIVAALTTAYQQIGSFMAENGYVRADQPMTINQIGGENGYELLAAIPVQLQTQGPEVSPGEGEATVTDPASGTSAASEAEGAGHGELPTETDSLVAIGKSPTGPAVRIIHRGPYSDMATSYQKLSAYMEVHDLAVGAISWEHYISDPGDTPEQDLVTHIYYQIAQ